MVLLIKALRQGRVHQVKLLLKVGVNVNLTDENGQTALMHCCFVEDNKTRMTMLKLLLTERVDPNKRDTFGRSFVSWASAFARVDILRFMLNDQSVDLDFNIVDNGGNSVLYLAVLSGDLETVQLVLKTLQKTYSLDKIHRTNNAGICPLLAAFHRGDKQCARCLITEGGAPLSSAIKYFQELANEGADPLDSHPFYAFSAKRRDPRVNFVDYNSNILTKKDVLGFLFTQDDMPSPPKHSNMTKTGLENLYGCQTKNSNSSDILPQHNSKKSTTGINSMALQDALDMEDSTPGCDSYIKLYVPIATGRISGDSSCFSSRESVLQLYDIYKEQLTDSYREGLPICRYRSPSPPSPPGKGSKTRPNCTSQQHGNDIKGLLSPKRGSVPSSSGSLSSMHESSLDKQIRMKCVRSNRAASMQVSKLPPIHGNYRKLKKHKSSSSFKLGNYS